MLDTEMDVAVRGEGGITTTNPRADFRLLSLRSFAIACLILSIPPPYPHYADTRDEYACNFLSGCLSNLSAFSIIQINMSGLAASRYGDDYARPSALSSQDPASSSHDETTYYDTTTAILDLGRERFDQDVAAVGDRDTALHTYHRQPVTIAKGRAPKGMEAQVFAWNAMQYTTEDKDEKEEAKGDLHGGQLHRQNRAAREPPPATFGAPPGLRDRSGRGGRGGRGGGRGRGGGAFQVEEEGFLRAAIKPDHPAPSLCKGFADELSADLFWDKPIV